MTRDQARELKERADEVGTPLIIEEFARCPRKTRARSLRLRYGVVMVGRDAKRGGSTLCHIKNFSKARLLLDRIIAARVSERMR